MVLARAEVHGDSRVASSRIQSKSLHPQAIPVYRLREALHFLFFGKNKALLMDTGSRNGNLAPTLRRTVKNWLARTGQTSIPLIVVHSHPHDDHTAGDVEVQAMHDPAMPVEFVPAELEATKRFWGIRHWPTDSGHVD